MCMGVNKLKFFVLSIMDDNCEDLIEQKNISRSFQFLLNYPVNLHHLTDELERIADTNECNELELNINVDGTTLISFHETY